VRHGGTTIKAIITSLGHWGCTVFAEVVVSTFVVEVVGNILFTRAVWDTCLKCILVYLSWVTTIAGTTGLTVDHGLCVETNWGGGVEVVEDIETISEG